MTYKSSSYTHPGHVRKNNEDAYYADDKNGLWIVCDGMGGHQEGNFASHLVTDTFEKLPLTDDFEYNIQLIIKNLENIQKNLIKKVNMIEDDCVIGTTLMLLYIQKDKAICIHAGDSRCYNLRNNRLSLVTVDHTQELVDNNEVKKVLTKALYAPGDFEIEEKKFLIKSNDVFLLCSDGLYDNTTNEVIKEAMKNHSLEEGIKLLSKNVLATTADDNLTAILVSIA